MKHELTFLKVFITSLYYPPENKKKTAIRGFPMHIID